MFPVGGVPVMLAGAAVSLLVFYLLHLALRDRLGAVTSVSVAGFLWSLTVIAFVTLIPAHAHTGYVPAADHQTSCSFDLGGPAPQGFWIFQSGQRALNTALFVPSGALLVVAAARWRAARWLVPIGLVALAAYSAGIEYTQLVVARLGRACDITDFVDNTTGAAIGIGVGIVLALVLRPWRYRRDRAERLRPGV